MGMTKKIAIDVKEVLFKPDDFLEENDFSRDEVREGLQEIVSRYGLGSTTEMFLK